MARLDGKVAYVTGAASGLGRAIAERFVREGASVAIADINREAGEALARELGAAAHFIEHDVTREEAWIDGLAAAARKFAQLDILVNNAGIAIIATIEKTTLAQWRQVHAVNLDGVFLGCKHVLPHLREAGGGSIINLSSIAGLIGDPALPAYCSSKGGVRLLTKSVALHCARRRDNIRCNSIHPVFAETPMLESFFANARQPEETRAALAKAIPLGRFAKPEEIAAMALYLASDEARFVTGAEFTIDGGLTAA